MYPEDLRYSDDHEWVRVAGDHGTVGITFYAQKQLGDVVFLELPELGRVLKAGENFGTVESVKAVSELLSPVAGEVIEINEKLVKEPEPVNSDPYGAGWMLVVKLSEPAAAQSLMDAKAYQRHVESEAK